MGEDDADAVIPIDPDLAPPQLARRGPGRPAPGVVVAIALGGMLGATARYEVAQALPTAAGHFPWATFWTNMSASFVLGFAFILLLEHFPPTRYLRPFLATGIIGAYSTMSTYLVETALLLKDSHVATGLLYGLGSIAVGLVLGYAGIVAARLVPGRHRAEHR
jgi:CrcB protein